MRASFEKITRGDGRSIRCFERAEAGYPFDWHYHPECELTLITASRGRRVVGDHLAEYAPGDLVLIGPNLPHTWASHGPASSVGGANGGAVDGMHRAVVVQFSSDVAGRSFSALPEARPIMELIERAGRGLALPVDRFADVAARVRRLPLHDATGRLIELLWVLREVAGRADDAEALASAGYNPRVNARAQRRIDAVCRRLHDHLAEPITQAELARAAGMSPAAFSRFFKRSTGRTVTEYLNELRVGHACRLLTETDLPILDVCYRSGYANVSNFNRRFRELKGETPSAFRRRYISG